MTESDVSNLSVANVMSLISQVTGKDAMDELISDANRNNEFESSFQMAASLRTSILQNRDNLQQSRIDIQQTRIESQQTRLDLSNFKDESVKLFGSFEQRINKLIDLNHERSNLLINDIRVICEEQVEQELNSGNKKRKLSATEEELLSLTDPHYIPEEDHIFGSHENSEDEEQEEEEEEDDDEEEEEEEEEIERDKDTALEEIEKEELQVTKKLPLYRLIRGTDSIKLIWEEYTNGVNGGPLVRDLELKYQGRWKDDTERKYFSYRKKLYHIIEKIMEVDNKSADEAIEYVESVISDPPGNKKSMTWLYDNISDRYK